MDIIFYKELRMNQYFIYYCEFNYVVIALFFYAEILHTYLVKNKLSMNQLKLLYLNGVSVIRYQRILNPNVIFGMFVVCG